MKIHNEKHGHVVHEVCAHNGMHTVTLKSEAGSVLDRVRCDTSSQARDYVKSFRKIAKVQPRDTTNTEKHITARRLA